MGTHHPHCTSRPALCLAPRLHQCKSHTSPPQACYCYRYMFQHCPLPTISVLAQTPPNSIPPLSVNTTLPRLLSAAACFADTDLQTVPSTPLPLSHTHLCEKPLRSMNEARSSGVRGVQENLRQMVHNRTHHTECVRSLHSVST